MNRPAPETNRTASLADEAYAQVEEMIITLALPPGQLLSEAELSRRLDVGRTPLREAIQRLTRDRLVEVLPRKGIMVSPIHLAEHLTLLDTRRVLDRLIHAQAARRITPEQRRRLSELAAAMQETSAVEDLASFMRLDKQFDEVVATASRNPFAADALAPLHAHCRRFWFMYRARGDLGRSTSLHAHIIDAVIDGDSDAAAATSDRLIDYLKDFTRATLASL